MITPSRHTQAVHAEFEANWDRHVRSAVWFGWHTAPHRNGPGENVTDEDRWDIHWTAMHVLAMEANA